ncbi:MAG: protein-disulfide reductase DsbD domain-containing protein [Edaphobacter sp.]
MDVYSGSFTVKLPVVAEPGTHTVAGTLRYQACDRAACYPPKNLPVQILFTAK